MSIELSTPRQKAPQPNGRTARFAAWCCKPPLLVSVTSIAVLVGSFYAGQASVLRQQLSDQSVRSATAGRFPFPTLDATSAVTSEKFSMATGYLSQDAEGLFVLDHNSGLLQCSVMYPRLGKFLGLFVVNVQEALGAGKGSKFIMTTGVVDIPSSNSNPVGSSVVYVPTTSTGNYACYYIPFNRTLMNSNKPQQGSLMLLATGSADPVIDRDAVR